MLDREGRVRAASHQREHAWAVPLRNYPLFGASLSGQSGRRGSTSNSPPEEHSISLVPDDDADLEEFSLPFPLGTISLISWKPFAVHEMSHSHREYTLPLTRKK
ncbi:unnamed protein product, partial [Nesidiocoris tenuis]